MATNVHLTPELENFARKCVEAGRYNNVSEVVRSGLRLLQEREEQRTVFLDMLRTVEDENKREGTVSLDDLSAELDAIIDEAEHRKNAAR